MNLNAKKLLFILFNLKQETNPNKLIFIKKKNYCYKYCFSCGFLPLKLLETIVPKKLGLLREPTVD